MCGIVGILNTKGPAGIREDLLLKMIAIIRHRGPDETGIYTDPHVGLGHARLSIIGLDDGTQPLCNEDGSLWIVYNGETFNYLELKEDLIQRGHRFTTETDTEVVLHLFEEYGPQCLEKINGQFSIAIWDVHNKELFLARDRLGIRPLYYCQTNSKIFFASEIKALFLNQELKREIEPKALAQVFTLWTTVTPWTVFKDVYEVPPGHFMTVKNGQITQTPYWRIPCYTPEEQFNGSFEEATEELTALLKDAVRLRLRADVPVGAYLSGGLDSSIITSLISKYFNNHLKTFSISFQEKPFDETPFQKDLVHFLSTEHSQTLIANQQIQEGLPNVIWHCEKPILRTAPVPLFFLSKLVRESNFKVVLTGEGADEAFGGYNLFKEAKIREFWAKHPDSKLRPLLLERLYPYIFKAPSRGRYFLQKIFSASLNQSRDPFFSHAIRWQNGKRNLNFFSAQLLDAIIDYDPMDELFERLPSNFQSLNGLSKAQFLEMDVFLSNYLLSSQGDRVAMAHSVEIRLPFLDYRLIDFALKLPPRFKMKALNEKYILKHAFDGFIPDHIRTRKKQPYRAPIGEAFFKGRTSPYIQELLSEEYVSKGDYFNSTKVEGLVRKYLHSDHGISNEIQNMAFMGILSTQLIHHQFIDHFPMQPVSTNAPDKAVRH